MHGAAFLVVRCNSGEGAGNQGLNLVDNGLDLAARDGAVGLVEGGVDIADAVEFAVAMRPRSCSLIGFYSLWSQSLDARGRDESGFYRWAYPVFLEQRDEARDRIEQT